MERSEQKPETDLSRRMREIGRALDVPAILALSPEKADVQEYYRVNRIPYSLFHTWTDRMYMGISRDGVYKEDDLLEGARIFAGAIRSMGAKDVLELATGRGANSAWLAAQFPDVRFKGIDLSPAQLALAYKKAKRLPNYIPAQGDYHDLSRFADGSFDLVFVVEALCYSTEKEKVLAEVRRVLRPGGLFIILDGYRRKEASELSQEQLDACGLAEKGMALKLFETYASFRSKALVAGFSIDREEDLSQFVKPTLFRFERISRAFFGHPILARTVSKILPYEFINNTVSAHLMPALVDDGTYCYMLTILRK